MTKNIIHRRIEILLQDAVNLLRLITADELSDETQEMSARRFIVAMSALSPEAIQRWLVDAFDTTRVPMVLIQPAQELLSLLNNAFPPTTWVNSRPATPEEKISYRHGVLGTSMERWYCPGGVTVENQRIDNQHFEGCIETGIITSLVGRMSTTHLT